MPRRRKDGRILKYTLKSGATRYMIKGYIGTDPATGKQIRVTRQGFKTYSEAEQMLSKYLADNGTSIEKAAAEKANRKTVLDTFKLWFPLYRTTVKESTAAKTLEKFEKHILPTFGDFYISRLPVDKVQTFVTILAGQMVSYDKVIAYFKKLICFAMIQGYTDNDPFSQVIMPNIKKKTKHRKNYYEKDELLSFLKAARKTNLKIYTYFLILGSTGLRRSEALALKWSDIDFKNNILSVNRTAALGINNRQLVQAPKTPKSRRVVPISDNLRQTLLSFKAERAKQGIHRQYIFGSFKDEPPYPARVYDWQKKVYQRAPGLRHITVHGFRHSFASLLIEQDKSIKPTDLQHLLGHEKVTTSLDIYTHVTKEGAKKVTRAINNLNL